MATRYTVDDWLSIVGTIESPISGILHHQNESVGQTSAILCNIACHYVDHTGSHHSQSTIVSIRGRGRWRQCAECRRQFHDQCRPTQHPRILRSHTHRMVGMSDHAMGRCTTRILYSTRPMDIPTMESTHATSGSWIRHTRGILSSHCLYGIGYTQSQSSSGELLSRLDGSIKFAARSFVTLEMGIVGIDIFIIVLDGGRDIRRRKVGHRNHHASVDITRQCRSHELVCPTRRYAPRNARQ